MPDLVPPLQIRPQGLLGLLDIKRGLAPERLGRDLAPTLDLVPWYLETNAEVIGTSPTPVAAGNLFLGLTVPANEWWYVASVAANLTAASALGAAQSCLFALHPGQFTTPTRIGPYSGFVAGTNGNTVLLQMDVQPFWLGPGGGLGVHSTQSLFTAPVNVDSAARIARLPF